MLPHPAKLALRFALVATVILWLGYVYAAVVVQWLLPLLRSAFAVLGSDFDLLRMSVEQVNGLGHLTLEADLAHAVIVNGHTIEPLRWNPQGGGWSEIQLTLGSVLSYPLLLGIIILAWPVRRPVEMLARIGLAIPLACVLLLSTPLTQIAELWFPIHDQLDPHHAWPLLVASRTVMSGGGLILAATLGFCAVGIARHFFATRLPHD